MGSAPVDMSECSFLLTNGEGETRMAHGQDRVKCLSHGAKLWGHNEPAEWASTHVRTARLIHHGRHKPSSLAGCSRKVW